MTAVLSRRGVVIGGGASLISFASTAFAEEPSQVTVVPKMGVAEHLLYSTIMIETRAASGSTGAGTGSFFELFLINGKAVPVIVTNKHVVAGASSATIRFTRKKSGELPDQGNTVKYEMSNVATRWIGHPDPTVDLAVCPIQPIVNDFEKKGTPIFYVAMNADLVPTSEGYKDLTPVEDVLVVGYPDGIADELHNTPIFRKGITASPASVDFNGKSEFLIDAAIYPGSSGSPVFLYNQGAWLNKTAQLQLGVRARLIGIVWGVKVHTQPGDIAVVPAPTQKAMSFTQLPNNLGVCVKASRILDFEPEFVRQGFPLPEGYIMRASTK